MADSDSSPDITIPVEGKHLILYAYIGIMSVPCDYSFPNSSGLPRPM